MSVVRYRYDSEYERTHLTNIPMYTPTMVTCLKIYTVVTVVRNTPAQKESRKAYWV